LGRLPLAAAIEFFLHSLSPRPLARKLRHEVILTMHFADSSSRASAQIGTDHSDPDAVLPLLHSISAQLSEIRAQLDGRMKSHLTVEEVAAVTGRVPYTIRRWISDGRIHAERVNGTGPRGRLLIPRSELDKLITSGLAGKSKF
jgi:excisionase family DNA binding protein